MSIKEETPNQQRKLVGALAATLGLVAIACSGDDDDSSATPGTAGKSNAEAGSSATGGKTGAMPSAGSAGKPTTTTGGNGGMPSLPGEGGAAGAAAMTPADIEPLNALLSAEYNAITAYTAGAGLIDAAPNTDPLFGLAEIGRAHV